MHISLDSALGRQRRLNSVGESITQIAPDPAAAYSLRSLTGGDPKVVRVRRASDNHEQDFTASDVSSGALQDFVNAQVVAPLDIQALSATGRDGDFLIAKAAYSLRSLGTRQATLAATGDTVARANGQFVAQVRRNVDGNLKSFTATEVTDGTLLSFVNESFTSSLPLDVQGSAAAAYSLRNLSSSYSGNVVEVRRSSDDTTQNFTAAEITDGTLLSFVGTGGSDNGFVKTWYDQSGNSNNAVQATASDQPKIVSSGSLVTVGVDFTDGKLMTFTSISAKTVVGVNQLTDTTNLSYLVGRTSNDKGVRTSGGPFLGADTGGGGSADFNNSGGSTHVNSSQSSFSATSKNVYFGTATSGFALTSLSTSFSASGILRAWRGKIAEIIIYDTDQSDNRRAIEESIATANGITLGSFNRDGFVKTWYDQSVTTQAGDTATGNHATQATAANQPKIVSAGSLLNELVFDGTDDILKTSESSTFSQPVSLFHVFNSSASVTSDYQLNAGNSSMLSGSDGSIFYFAGTLLNSTIDFPTSGDTLHSVLFNGASSTVHADGTSVASGNIGSGNFSKSFGIGGRTSDSQFSDMSFKEIIIYDTDQTDNRTAIEANIGEVYSIDLPSGVDPGDNAVDGFVETWYDQSGNGNNATQATAGSQPKIVNAGALVSGGTGKPTLSFDAASKRFFSASVASTQPFTTTAQFNGATSSVVNSTEQNLIDSQASSQTCFIQIGSTGDLILNSGNALNSGRDMDSFGESVVIAVSNGASSSIDFNAATQVTGNAGTNDRDAIRIGKHRTGDGNYFNGNMSELIIHNSQLSNTIIDAVESNVISHYGITEI